MLIGKKKGFVAARMVPAWRSNSQSEWEAFLFLPNLSIVAYISSNVKSRADDVANENAQEAPRPPAWQAPSLTE